MPLPDPLPIVAAKAAPPLLVLAGFTFVAGTHRQFSLLALAGRKGELPLQPASSLAGSRWSDRQAGPLLVRHRVVLWARPCRAAQRASSSSLSRGGALLPHTPSNRRTALLSSSTGCSRVLNVRVLVVIVSSRMLASCKQEAAPRASSSSS